MTLIVRVVGRSLAAGTVVPVVADSALVADTLDVALARVRRASWTIAVDAVVLDCRLIDSSDLLVQRREAVTGVS